MESPFVEPWGSRRIPWSHRNTGPHPATVGGPVGSRCRGCPPGEPPERRAPQAAPSGRLRSLAGRNGKDGSRDSPDDRWLERTRALGRHHHPGERGGGGPPPPPAGRSPGSSCPVAAVRDMSAGLDAPLRKVWLRVDRLLYYFRSWGRRASSCSNPAMRSSARRSIDEGSTGSCGPSERTCAVARTSPPPGGRFCSGSRRSWGPRSA